MSTEVTVSWVRCESYEEAREHRSCVYVHEWFGEAYYIGKIGKVTWFGGRYNTSYRHWIDGCLEHGARLYVGRLAAEHEDLIDVIEYMLLGVMNPPKNVRKTLRSNDVTLLHVGQVPAQLQERHDST